MNFLPTFVDEHVAAGRFRGYSSRDKERDGMTSDFAWDPLRRLPIGGAGGKFPLRNRQSA
jgi:hypothetical protein